MLGALREAVPAEWCALNELPADLPRTISLAEPEVPQELHVAFARYALQNPLVEYYLRTNDGRAPGVGGDGFDRSRSIRDADRRARLRGGQALGS